MTLALIAGTGGLPSVVAAALVARDDPPVVCEMPGFPSEVTPDLPRLYFRLETLGTFLAILQEAGVTRICMAGAMSRPEIDPAAFDDRTRPLVPRLSAALAKGDDGTLREFIALFEEHGLKVIGAHEIAPDLLPPAGNPTGTIAPVLDDDIALARQTLARMGAEDLGQAVVIREGTLLATEDAQGTNALISKFIPKPERKSLLRTLWEFEPPQVDDGRVEVPEAHYGSGAILYKGPKPSQDLRVDMPTIGPATAELAAQAAFRGIVIEAGGVIVLDLEEVLRVLDGHSMFLKVVRR